MDKLKLEQHKFHKGRFTTPFNSIANISENPWIENRLADYVWLALIIKKYGREDAFRKLFRAITKIEQEVPILKTLRQSEILSLDIVNQKKFYTILKEFFPKETLAPLSIVITLSVSKVFVECFFHEKLDVSTRLSTLLSTLQDLMDHQSELSTDIRYLVIMFFVAQGKACFPSDLEDKLFKYPSLSHDDERMRDIRPYIRAFEIAFTGTPSDFFPSCNINFANIFWKKISLMTECQPMLVNSKTEETDMTSYLENLSNIFYYLRDLLVKIEHSNKKMEVIIGISTYSYKRFREICDYKLYNTISGRSNLRNLIENLITIKYLLHIENEKVNVWDDFQSYGIGAYKMTLSKYREANHENTFFKKEYIEALVNEFRSEHFTDIDTNYFNKDNIRKKAEKVNEKDLYDFLYDYGSSFEHGLWGAIRETSFIKCVNPAHQYHCIPDIDSKIVYSSILPDSITIINKLLILLDELYELPKKILEEVVNFEVKSTI